MRKIFFSFVTIFILFFTGCATLNKPTNNFIGEQMQEKYEIINITQKVGTLADQRKWSELETLFASKVNLDYSSMTQQDAESLEPKVIMQRWAAFLPGFDWTSHKNTNQKVNIQDDKAKAYSDVKAVHYIKNAKDGEFWVVNGSYDYELSKIDGKWKITSMRLNFKDTEGNNNLPTLALEKIKGK